MKLFSGLTSIATFVAALATASTAHAVAPVAFDVGGEHACISTDCDITQCWGGPNNTFGEAADRMGPAIDVAVGTDHTCTLDPDGYATCWGRSDAELGLLDASTERFRDIEAGAFHTCGIRRSGAGIECWGWDRGGSVTGVRAGAAYRQLDSGYDYSCAVTTGQNAIDCWGDNVPGGVVRLLSWDVLRNHNTKFEPERFEKVAVGYRHFCFISTYQDVYCAGETNDAAQLSPWYRGNPETPVGEVVGLTWDEAFKNHSEFESEWGWLSQPLIHRQYGNYVDVGASILGTCAQEQGDDPWCWGYPFDFGWGSDLGLATVPTRLVIGPTNYCGWNRTTGAIDCVAESPHSDLDDVEPLLTCGG
jgi:hypothetical protein